MKYSYYPGCTLRTKAKDLDAYARASAKALGIELEEIEDWQCCGQLTEAGFEALYGKYLLWQCPSAEGHSLKQLCEGAVNI